MKEETKYYRGEKGGLVKQENYLFYSLDSNGNWNHNQRLISMHYGGSIYDYSEITEEEINHEIEERKKSQEDSLRKAWGKHGDGGTVHPAYGFVTLDTQFTPTGKNRETQVLSKSTV